MSWILMSVGRKLLEWAWCLGMFLIATNDAGKIRQTRFA